VGALMAVLSKLTLTPNDRDRERLIVWHRHGIPGGPALLGDKPAGRGYAGRGPWDGDEFWQSEIVLRPGTPLGVHPLTLGGTHVADITVTGNRPRTPIYTVTPSSVAEDTAAIEYALSRPSPVVRLAPGEYRTTRPIFIPNGKTLTGHGALVSGPDRMFAPGNDVTVRGLTITSSGAVFHNDNGGRRLVVSDCTFRDCYFGTCAHEGELEVARCLFERSSAMIVTGGTWRQCRWVGQPVYGTSSFIAYRADRLALVDCVFDDCDKGPGLTGNWDIYNTGTNDPLLLNVTVRGPLEGSGGSEVFSFEVPTDGFGRYLRRAVVMHFNATGDGQINLFAGNVDDCLFRVVNLKGVDLLLTAGRPGESMTNNVFEEGRSDGGQILFGPHAHDNTVRRWQFARQYQGSRNVNLRPYHHSPVTRFAVWADPASHGNRVIDCAYDLPVGWGQTSANIQGVSL
jgi:hypothetical protein